MKIIKNKEYKIDLYKILDTPETIIEYLNSIKDKFPKNATLEFDLSSDSWGSSINSACFTWEAEETDEEAKQRIENEKAYIKISLDNIEKQKLHLIEMLKELENDQKN